MATKLFLRNTTTNGITDTGDGVVYDMLTVAGAGVDTDIVTLTDGGTQIQWTQSAGGSSIAWISGRVPSGGFTLTTTDISVWLLESNMNDEAEGRYRVFKYTPGTPTITELGGGPFDDGVELGTTITEMTWAGNVTDTAFAENDRILLRLYATNFTTMTAGTANLQFNAADASTGDSFFNIAETVSFKAEAVEVALTGTNVVGTGGVGTLAVSISAALSGNVGTGAVGTFGTAVSYSAALTGVEGTGDVGSLVPSFSLALTGETGTGAVGTLGTTVTIALSGETGTGTVGSFAASISIALGGNEGTGAVEAMAASIAAVLSGNVALGDVGTIDPSSSGGGGGVVVAFNRTSMAGGVTLHQGVSKPSLLGQDSTTKQYKQHDFKPDGVNRETYTVDGELP